MSETIREEARTVIRDAQTRTVEICIEAIEGLHLDNQGLPLDGYTVSACARLLRNLRDGHAKPAERT